MNMKKPGVSIYIIFKTLNKLKKLAYIINLFENERNE